jgi:hypothetical protein
MAEETHAVGVSMPPSDKFRRGAEKAWATRRKKGWHRKTRGDDRAELLVLAHQKLTGFQLKRAEKWLTKRYRSKAREMQVLEMFKEKLKR